MLTVTDNAKAMLAETLTRENAPTDVALRLAQEEEQLGLKPDREGPNDEKYAHEGKTVLLVEENLANDALSDRVLDVSQTESGAQLTLSKEGGDQEEA